MVKIVRNVTVDESAIGNNTGDGNYKKWDPFIIPEGVHEFKIQEVSFQEAKSKPGKGSHNIPAYQVRWAAKGLGYTTSWVFLSPIWNNEKQSPNSWFFQFFGAVQGLSETEYVRKFNNIPEGDEIELPDPDDLIGVPVFLEIKHDEDRLNTRAYQYALQEWLKAGNDEAEFPYLESDYYTVSVASYSPAFEGGGEADASDDYVID